MRPTTAFESHIWLSGLTLRIPAAALRKASRLRRALGAKVDAP